MNRTHLVEVLYELAYEAGWHFHTAPEASMGNLIEGYPTLWLSSLKLLEQQGRHHGRIRYGVTLHLLTEGAQLTPNERMMRHGQMEQHLLELMSSVSEQERILSVEELQLTPRTFAFTPHGELAVTAECEIITSF